MDRAKFIDVLRLLVEGEGVEKVNDDYIHIVGGASSGAGKKDTLGSAGAAGAAGAAAGAAAAAAAAGEVTAENDTENK